MANEIFDKRRRRARYFWIGAILLAVALIAWGMWPRPTTVDVAAIDTGTVRLDLVDEGRTRMHDVYTISAPVAGRLQRVEVEPGDAVEQGTVIARMTQAQAGFLDTRSDIAARAAVDAAEAALRASDAELELARREHERTSTLAADRLVAQSAADNSQARLDATRAARDARAAELARARSALQPADRRGGASVAIRSPAAGRVLSVPQKSENVLPAGSPLVLIGDPSHVEVVAEFLSQDAVRMQPGAPATIENWGGAPLAATVGRIEPVARMKVSALGVEEQRTNVILQFTDAATAARLGHDYRVDARVTIEEVQDAVRAPLGALFRHGEGWAVYKVVDGRARLTPVTTGIADTSYRQITDGLAAGDTVILFPASTVSEGLRVTPRPQ
jgi:HlyD family secretion protein